MTCSKDDILGEIMRFLGERITTADAITPETNVARDLGLDSLAVMDLLMALEDRFDVSIPLNCLPDVETVSDLATTIGKVKSGVIKA